MDDSHDLDRFVKAQISSYKDALAELRAGRKRSHWMWYIFPQFAGLGVSSTSQKYAIKSIDDARAYLAHPVLGPRLAECCDAVLAIEGRTAYEIMGTPDDLKLRSCATLFGRVVPAESVYERVLERYFQGAPDEATLRLIAAEGSRPRLA
jgi:uncharacterized protein (DUF1810 family)